MEITYKNIPSEIKKAYLAQLIALRVASYIRYNQITTSVYTTLYHEYENLCLKHDLDFIIVDHILIHRTEYMAWHYVYAGRRTKHQYQQVGYKI